MWPLVSTACIRYVRLLVVFLAEAAHASKVAVGSTDVAQNGTQNMLSSLHNVMLPC